ncbi:hypothetical protein LTR36_006101 [Oleoguttula mirabilis]|uniref:Peptidase A1 domain-containing protein n=1 Tax=Oleoguttula mirabilis TaxID=1507867 RepID=A0AAV9JCG2_9PEZI|nr:hypothetical protein LTR36_006101 [Oleoguttula mirabilis]
MTAVPSDPGYCGYLRGTVPVSGANTSGFANNESSTWDLIGLYTLDAQELQLGYSGNGLYGFDIVSLIDGNGSDVVLNQTKQVVAGVVDLDFWLGVFGLGPKSVNFTTFNDPIPNFMSDLVNSNQIPSLSWGYTAGTYYRNQTPASLTLGGYDAYRLSGTDYNFSMNEDNSRPLQVSVQGITAENTPGGISMELLPTATYHFIDSTLPHICLLEDAVQGSVDNFGLTYDNNTDLYLINDTMRNQWLQHKPTVTFVIGASDNPTIAAGSTASTDEVEIELPYAAFDMQASYPYYQSATNYFPIRKAANDSQYTLGRTFLQEAYLTADFGRNSFAVAQTSLVESGALVAWYFIRRNKRKHQLLPTSDLTVGDSETVFPSDKMVDTPYSDQHRGSELPAENALHEAPGLGNKQNPSELTSGRGNEVSAEMEGDMGQSRVRPGMAEMPSAPSIGHAEHVMAEAPGSEGKRHEPVGSEPGEAVD